MDKVESLNETIAQKKKEKYDPNLELAVKKWIIATVDEPFLSSESPIFDLLKDGVLLCKYVIPRSPASTPKIAFLFKIIKGFSMGYSSAHIRVLNKVAPGLVPRINTATLPFKQMVSLVSF